MYGVIAFIFFGSGDLQPWAKPPTKKDEDTYVDETKMERLSLSEERDV